jgi:DNA polymerase-3 subunit gamma/tau
MAGDVSSPAGTDPAPRGAPAAPAALYRRYRPATFAELRGQDHVTEPLRQALRSGRVHHAYLFSGPRGCGKTSSARILARSLNCEQGPTPDPCGKCASCVALAPSGPGSIDVIEIDAASHGGVDDARDLRERAFYAPVAGRFKIYIVDEAHMVTREGFNALLKLVEEPPPHLKFVFATTEPEKVIPTIRSRTHHYPFRLMPPAILRGLLEEILASEGVRYEPAVLPVVVRAGAGSARDALSVLDQLLAGSDEIGLTYERAVALLGYTDDSLLDEVAEAFASGDGAAVFRAVDRVIEGGHDPRRFAADLLDRFRDLIVLAAVPDAGQTGLLDVPADRLDRMREQAASFGPAQLARAAETINAGLVEMRGATSPRLQLELICAQVLLPAPAAGEAALLARIERLERQVGSGAPKAPGNDAARPASAAPAVRPAPPPTPEARPAPTEPAARPAPPAPGARPENTADQTTPANGAGADAGPPADTAAARPAGNRTPDADLVRERWPEILDAVRHRSKVAWAQLSNATVDALQDGVLTLRFAQVGTAAGFSARRSDDLGQVLEQVLGISPKIKAVSAAAHEGRAGTGPGGTGPRGAGRSGAGPGGAGQGGAGHGGVGRGGAGPGGADAAGTGPRGAGPGGADAAGTGPRGAGPGGAGRGSQGSAGAGGPGIGEAGGAGIGEAGASRGGVANLGADASARGGADVGAAARGVAGGQAPRRDPGPAAPDRAAPGGPGEPDHDPEGGALSGMDLIQRTLGGRVIEEYGDA